MAISKQAISSQIKATIRSIQVDGEDHVDTFVDIIVNAIIDELWANGEFKGMVTGGGCTHSGTHPPVPVEGKIY
jgi:hypothetical protein